MFWPGVRGWGTAQELLGDVGGEAAQEVPGTVDDDLLDEDHEMGYMDYKYSQFNIHLGSD